MHNYSGQGYVVHPFLPFSSQGAALRGERERMCWRGGTAAAPAHPLLSAPHAGREQSEYGG